jgi:large subunit ribosomal protein L19
MSDLMKIVEAEYSEARAKFPSFKAGDTINVHVRIKEGNKERIQQFQGTVIQRKNPNSNGETFTVRKISNGIGVERIFPVNLPALQKIEINKKGHVRRARIFYFRELTGKKAKIRDKRR